MTMQTIQLRTSLQLFFEAHIKHHLKTHTQFLILASLMMTGVVACMERPQDGSDAGTLLDAGGNAQDAGSLAGEDAGLGGTEDAGTISAACQAEIDIWLSAISDAADDDASFACDEDSDCGSYRERCESCGGAFRFNTQTVAEIDGVFPECNACPPPSVEPCPEPDAPPPGCFEGRCR